MEGTNNQKAALGARQPHERAAPLASRELEQVLYLFNNTKVPYPHERLIHEVFEGNASRNPEAMAVVHGSQRLTYAELNAKANQLARHLRSEGVQAGDYIPVHMPRGLQLLIAQVAILKSGGVYVPIDPDLPEERKSFILKDCRAHRILLDGHDSIGSELENLRYIDCRQVFEASAILSDNLGLQLDPLHPAYVMYTSGSTGIPKGVITPHRAVNRLAVNNGYTEIERVDCIAHCSNPGFDAATFEVWGALLNGARVAIFSPADVLDAARFATAIQQHGVTALFLTTALFNQYARTSPEMFASLKYLLFGGEAADARAVRRILDSSPPRSLLNVYGPTETTTFATTWRITALPQDVHNVPIGRPISNTQVYILDSKLLPVPVDEVGEMYIGGEGLALGYLNRPDITSERFLPDPFGHSRVLYKTGDLARWRADGIIEYIGRNDFQVKIRGFRVELGEVEAALLTYPDIEQAVAVIRETEPGEKRLLGYVVVNSARQDQWIPQLLSFLKRKLPSYMVPTTLVALSELPLTPNGKVDRAKLPIPDARSMIRHSYVAAENSIERKLAEILRKLLNLEQLGIDDNFFELGGHSIMGMELIAYASETFSISLPANTVFEHPTIRKMAVLVESIQTAEKQEVATSDLDFEEGIV
jgi:amino acid adenylation domain-containing protein